MKMLLERYPYGNSWRQELVSDKQKYF